MSKVDPRLLLTVGFSIYAGARMPGVSMVHAEHDGITGVWLMDQAGSGAFAEPGDETWQYGERDLWWDVETTYQEYEALGSPDARVRVDRDAPQSGRVADPPETSDRLRVKARPDRLPGLRPPRLQRRWGTERDEVEMRDWIDPRYAEVVDVVDSYQAWKAAAGPQPKRRRGWSRKSYGDPFVIVVDTRTRTPYTAGH
ncbi:hypothetical protein [Streptomyces spiramyceticus]|uniref:hypothetical protein n=1 Tax=Streptomyces spiramyceticus TaxID=299717 RepID=UPI00237A4A03|nr:hypothetical protein [Streptomyces spiramyceticus]